MKIAVCISGQLRQSWRKCIPTWNKIFSEHEVYYFGHTWTTRSAPNFVKVTKGIDDTETIDNNEFQELRRELKRLDLKVMEQIEFEPGLDQALHDVNYQSQFYGVMYASFLKKKYEIENNSHFDLCIRMRWDCMFDEEWTIPEPKKDTLQVIHLGFEQGTHRSRCGDLYWQGPTDVYDVACDFYSHFDRHPKEYFEMPEKHHYGPEHVFMYYLKECNLTLEQIFPPVKLVRPKEEHMTGGGDYETL